jgi:hypothetical protein
MCNPWDIPPWPDRGDDEPDQLYRAVGKALTSWELIEEVMARLFGLFTSTTHQYPQTAPAIRAYGSVMSFNGRAEMVVEAGRCFFHGYRDDRTCPFESHFEPFVKECKGWSGRRNDLAHGRVGHVPNGYFLFPGLYNTRKQPLGEDPKYCYNSGQITKFSDGFEDLYDRLSEYAGSVDVWLWTLLRNTISQPSAQMPLPPENPQDNQPPP